MKLRLIIFVSGLFFIMAIAKAQPHKLLIPLNGPWKFQTGDDIHRVQPGFDDSRWESAGLTPKAGSHDDDVGITGYVPGWGQKGHPGYFGFAWYRLHLPAGLLQDAEEIGGPPDVDDVYQLYFNGTLLGGAGDFSGRVPTVYSVQPRVFIIPKALRMAVLAGKKPAMIAIRVWVSPRTMSEADDAGGIHVAPLMGDKTSVEANYRRQWLQTFWGYVVDAVEPLLFIILAIFCFRLAADDLRKLFYRWFAAALIITALVRASQVFYYWGQFESLKVFYLSKEVILIPLSLGAWAMAGYKWQKAHDINWLPKFVYILTLVFILTAFFSFSWQFEVPHAHSYIFNTAINYIRLIFMLLMIFIIIRNTIRQDRHKYLVLIAALLLFTGLFAQELSVAGIPGIWFPFGVGVSRTQFAYAAFELR